MRDKILSGTDFIQVDSEYYAECIIDVQKLLKKVQNGFAPNLSLEIKTPNIDIVRKRYSKDSPIRKVVDWVTVHVQFEYSVESGQPITINFADSRVQKKLQDVNHSVYRTLRYMLENGFCVLNTSVHAGFAAADIGFAGYPGMGYNYAISPSMDKKTAFENFITNVMLLGHNFFKIMKSTPVDSTIPVDVGEIRPCIENLNYHPKGRIIECKETSDGSIICEWGKVKESAYEYFTEPENLLYLVKEYRRRNGKDLGLLLDMGHAAVTSYYLNISPIEYVKSWITPETIHLVDEIHWVAPKFSIGDKMYLAEALFDSYESPSRFQGKDKWTHDSIIEPLKYVLKLRKECREKIKPLIINMEIYPEWWVENAEMIFEICSSV